MADIFSDCMSCSCRRRRSVWSSNTSTAEPGSAIGMVGRSSARSPARISTEVADGSAMARATGSDQAGGRRPSQGRPGIAVTGIWISSANTRLARRTVPCASTTQIAWEMASTVFSHSRLADDSSSTRRAFSSAMAPWARTSDTRVSSGLPSAPARSLETETAPMVRPAATRGAPIHEPGASPLSSAPRRRASWRALRGHGRGPRPRASCGRGGAGRRARYEQLLLEQGPDPLLDEPGLLEALLAVRSLAVPSPPLFAYVAVRHALRAAAVDDRELADYLAALLLEFGDHDRHMRIRRADDESYSYLVDIVEDLTGLDDAGERGLLLRVHLGNYSLWFAGLFPDYIEARRTRKGGPDLPYYDEVGRQGYRLASEHRLAERFGVASIYRSAAERFPALRVAFNRLSDGVFFRNVTTPEKILRNP